MYEQGLASRDFIPGGMAAFPLLYDTLQKNVLMHGTFQSPRQLSAHLAIEYSVMGGTNFQAS